MNPFLHSLSFFFSKLSDDCSPNDIIHIYHRCRRSLDVVTPTKYECDSTIKYNFAKTQKSITEELTPSAIVMPYDDMELGQLWFR